MAKENIGLVLLYSKAEVAVDWGLREVVLKLSERLFAEPTKRNRLLCGFFCRLVLLDDFNLLAKC